MIVGFVWAGLVTGSNAQAMAEDMAKDAVTERLAAVCVAQFGQDPGNGQKLAALRETSSYQRDNYVSDQGWATMPGEERPDRGVADECAKQLMLIGQ
jgi:hypothetical protein